LRFGDFILKSGRNSPYFFNTGLFNTGASLRRLGEYYTEAIIDWGGPFDALFGPAYKGIPIVTTTAIALSQRLQQPVPYSFDRKEAKDHAEGGVTVGADLRGRVLILDDVISAGISVDLAVDIIRHAGATPAGVFIALDRQERAQQQNGRSAAEAVPQRHGLPGRSVVPLSGLLEFLGEEGGYTNEIQAIEEYCAQYGAK
jgi:orotate phosphoribosyltransferase